MSSEVKVTFSPQLGISESMYFNADCINELLKKLSMNKNLVSTLLICDNLDSIRIKPFIRIFVNNNMVVGNSPLSDKDEVLFSSAFSGG